MKAQCTVFNGKKLNAFQPLAPITEEWENYFIELKNIKLADIYYPPYNFERTGCKGCPYKGIWMFWKNFFRMSENNVR